MPDNNFQTIYDSSDEKEYDKYWLYIMLLERNERFMRDVSELRKKYSITLGTQTKTSDIIDNEYSEILNNTTFIDDVMKISSKIKLAGDWSGGLAYYICGAAAQSSLFPDSTDRRIEARAVRNGKEPYYEMRIYGDFTRAELMEATKIIRSKMVKSMGYKKVKKLDDNVMIKMLLFKEIGNIKSDKEVADELSEIYGYRPQSYSDLRSQMASFKSYSDRLY